MEKSYDDLVQRNLLIIVGVVLVLAVVGGGFFLFLNKKTTTNQNSSDNQSVAQLTPTKSTLNAIINGGKNVACTTTFAGGTGIVYVSGSKMHSDYSTTVEGKTISGHMTSDGQYTYVWQEGSSVGTKFKITDTNNSQSQKSGIDLNSENEVNCSDWKPETSKFELPNTITFSELVSGMGETQKETESLPKSTCDSVTDPTAKAACQSAVGN